MNLKWKSSSLHRRCFSKLNVSDNAEENERQNIVFLQKTLNQAERVQHVVSFPAVAKPEALKVSPNKETMGLRDNDRSEGKRTSYG